MDCSGDSHVCSRATIQRSSTDRIMDSGGCANPNVTVGSSSHVPPDMDKLLEISMSVLCRRCLAFAQCQDPGRIVLSGLDYCDFGRDSRKFFHRWLCRFDVGFGLSSLCPLWTSFVYAWRCTQCDRLFQTACHCCCWRLLKYACTRENDVGV